ncbi:IclR family transcriptional regulator [Shouchella shacheensis]|uniref:IclR family transcriptional regulator n=1 Tax=Shouchella shacheensis TaxID=1649580 RepID=UPI000AA75D02|nr:IclR family transcriptional regulator [Shouchella shacheensis]
MLSSVQRALALLEELKLYKEGVGVTELANRLEVAKSTTHRLLISLEEYGYVRKRGEGRYQLGLKFLEMHQSVLSQLDVVELARPIMEKLCQDVGEIVHLVEQQGDHVIYLNKVEQQSSALRVHSRIGSRAPMYCTGVGKLLLAHQDPARLDRYFSDVPLKAYTPQTLTEQDVLLETFAAIRKEGYSLDDSEHEPDIRCVAAPVFNHEQKVLYALSVTGPASRMDSETIKSHTENVMQAAQELSNQLGATAH